MPYLIYLPLGRPTCGRCTPPGSWHHSARSGPEFDPDAPDSPEPSGGGHRRGGRDHHVPRAEGRRAAAGAAASGAHGAGARAAGAGASEAKRSEAEER